MASFFDILVEVINADDVNKELENMGNTIKKVEDESKDSAEALAKMPQQIQGLKTWLEQQKKVGNNQTTEKNEQQKTLSGGIGTQTSITDKNPATMPAAIAQNQLKPVAPVMAKQVAPAKPVSVMDILKTKTLPKS